MGVKVATTGRGVVLPGAGLALDTTAPGCEVVVSHAHGDHIPWEATRAYASPETADLLAIRTPVLQVEVLPWREPVKVGRARVTLYPAGHILGSALTHVETPDGDTLLYTGDTKVRESLTCPPAEYPGARTLIVESTFGLPIFVFPPREEVEARAVAFARQAVEEGVVPVFYGYALGKGQEITAMLGRAGVPVSVHGAAWRLQEVYERHGVAFPHSMAYSKETVKGRALVTPASFRHHPMVTTLDARVAYVSGWALLARSRAQMDADILLPLSDHADYPGLLEIVERVRPERVLTNHGYADVFAHLLRKQGLDAQPLSVGHVDEDIEMPGGSIAGAVPDPQELPPQRRLES